MIQTQILGVNIASYCVVLAMEKMFSTAIYPWREWEVVFKNCSPREGKPLGENMINISALLSFPHTVSHTVKRWG